MGYVNGQNWKKACMVSPNDVDCQINIFKKKKKIPKLDK